jgi:ferredoxin-thioredoxin reductase catalytic subunit
MKGYVLNPNKEYVDIIINGILKKDGHCPCRKLADDTTLCPCDEFVKTGICKCNLFVKKETDETVEKQEDIK